MFRARIIRLTIAAALGCVALVPAAAVPPSLVATPIVIGHRGAAAYRPEHTLEGYALAIEMGADFVEPDLVSTRDRVLVARHECYIGGDNPDFAGADSTDVARRPEFASRKKTVNIDGVELTGWFTEDFTLAELKTLRANERLPKLRPRSAAYDGRFAIPTLQEIIDLVRARERATGRTIGIYPETKHPSYHASIGLALEEPLLAVLAANGYDGPRDAIFIQSFEVANLKALARRTRAPLVQLFGGAGKPYDFVVAGDPRSWDDLATPAGLAAIATYARAVGPAKARVLPYGDEIVGKPTSFVADAHAAGLLVHAYTFRSENAFLPGDFKLGRDPGAPGDHAAEYARFLALGVDGLFADNPDHARRARDLAIRPSPDHRARDGTRRRGSASTPPRAPR